MLGIILHHIFWRNIIQKLYEYGVGVWTIMTFDDLMILGVSYYPRAGRLEGLRIRLIADAIKKIPSLKHTNLFFREDIEVSLTKKFNCW